MPDVLDVFKCDRYTLLSNEFCNLFADHVEDLVGPVSLAPPVLRSESPLLHGPLGGLVQLFLNGLPLELHGVPYGRQLRDVDG
ncbi:MAG: hypothetical protein NO515_05145, partial [Candidatus Methanomethylicia archaeon]|nr:hypothetical protein [Candidatus Methanomethylicia archaeon]